MVYITIFFIRLSTMRISGVIVDGAIKIMDHTYQQWKKIEHQSKKALGLISKEEKFIYAKELTEQYDIGRLIEPLISNRGD